MTGEAEESEVGYAGVRQSWKETPTAVRIVLLGVFITYFGAFLEAFLVLYLLDRDFSAQQAGIALGAYAVGTIVGVLFGGGLLYDRLGPRWTIVVSMGSAALLTLSVTALDSFLAILVAVTLSGALTQASRPAVTALLLGLVPAARQVMTMAMYRTAFNTGLMIGPLVAAWLSTISWDLVLWLEAATALTYVAIAALMLPRNHVTEVGEQTPADGEPRASYLLVLRDGRYVAYLALMLGNGLVHVQALAVLPLMLHAAGYATWAYSSLAVITTGLLISTELFVTKTTQTWPAWVAVLGGWALLVIGRGAWGLPGGFTVLIMAAVIGIAGQIIGGAQAFAYPGKVAPPGAMSRYVGSAHAMFALGYAIGPPAGVLLWTQMGNSFWALCPALGLVVGVLGLWGMRPATPRPTLAVATS